MGYLACVCRGRYFVAKATGEDLSEVEYKGRAPLISEIKAAEGKYVDLAGYSAAFRKNGAAIGFTAETYAARGRQLKLGTLFRYYLLQGSLNSAQLQLLLKTQRVAVNADVMDAVHLNAFSHLRTCHKPCHSFLGTPMTLNCQIKHVNCLPQLVMKVLVIYFIASCASPSIYP